MLLTTKIAWSLLLDGESEEVILRHCSLSSLQKLRALYNRQKKEGSVEKTLEKFPQKSRAKSKKKKKKNKSTKLPPSNYPQAGKPDVKITENFNKGEKSFDIKSYEIKTLDDLIKYADIDMDKFECASFTSNRWGNSKWECTQCKGVFKPKSKSNITPEEIADIFKSMVEDYSPKHITYERNSDCKNIAIMPIADFHFGAYARKDEVGSNNNLEISEDNLMKSVAFHIESIKKSNPSVIIIPLLGDFFNVDTSTNTTTAGTYQEETSSWKNTFRKGCGLMISVIDKCVETAPVKLIICNGNHDLTRSFAMGLVLEAWYKNSNTVMIDDSHSVRKYESFGNSIFGFGHGDTKANADYLGIMCGEAQHLSLNAKYKDFFIGHLHHKTIEEKPGITIRRIGSLTSSDHWHKTKGYQSIRSSESYIIDKEDGICANYTFYLR